MAETYFRAPNKKRKDNRTKTNLIMQLKMKYVHLLNLRKESVHSQGANTQIY
jgi:hypothetical protein